MPSLPEHPILAVKGTLFHTGLDYAIQTSLGQERNLALVALDVTPENGFDGSARLSLERTIFSMIRKGDLVGRHGSTNTYIIAYPYLGQPTDVAIVVGKLHQALTANKDIPSVNLGVSLTHYNGTTWREV